MHIYRISVLPCQNKGLLPLLALSHPRQMESPVVRALKVNAIHPLSTTAPAVKSWPLITRTAVREGNLRYTSAVRGAETGCDIDRRGKFNTNGAGSCLDLGCGNFIEKRKCGLGYYTLKLLFCFT